MAGHPKGPKKEKDSQTSVSTAINDLGARCPSCQSLETIEANKEGTKRLCMNSKCSTKTYNV